jgi:hypothetical protein
MPIMIKKEHYGGGRSEGRPPPGVRFAVQHVDLPPFFHGFAEDDIFLAVGAARVHSGRLHVLRRGGGISIRLIQRVDVGTGADMVRVFENRGAGEWVLTRESHLDVVGVVVERVLLDGDHPCSYEFEEIEI